MWIDSCPIQTLKRSQLQEIAMDNVINQFKTRANTYSGSANWITDANLLQAHLDSSGKTPPGSVLEMCCGTGVVGRNFRAAGWHVCGIDLTQQMAEEANQYFPCICTPAEKIPFLDKSFDLVVLRQAYFLLEDGQKALSEAHRVLKDDGIFILSQTVPFSQRIPLGWKRFIASNKPSSRDSTPGKASPQSWKKPISVSRIPGN